MANNEAGAFLNITPDVLKKLDSFDEKLEKIEKHAHTAADALKNGFGKVVIDTTKLENAITSLANKMNALNSAGNAIGNIGTSAQGSARNVSSMNESLSRAALLMNQIGNSKISESSFSTWNIKGLNQYYSDLKKYVENADLSKPQQEAAIRAMQYMKMELTEQRKTDEQRAQSAEKAAQRKEEADRRAAKAAADLAKQQELAQRTTPQGALDYSKNTKSLKENVQAIEYLKKARLSLNTTDKNYQTTLQQINQAIAKHNQALQQAGVQSQNLATRHRNLMDTAGQLQRKIALVFSVSQIEGYISKLANVRGEFELQQRSLQAILQNKSQADQIFNKTVQLAVKSHFKIKELISYTKQLAAYRIESSKLYDTTKRLADVSAGLGVDMQRLILAYGQVKAAAYLRGTEVRQFTEAGINLYGELQRYFEEVKGEAYTTAQIVDMISKRKVTFEDIENIFKRLTESGGLFYNMQEIQAETLQGKISNLQDSIDVMLNSIGKANEDTLKGTIDAVKVLIDNWETVVEVAKTLGVVIGSLVITSKLKLASAEAGILTKMLEKGTSAATAFGKTLKASLPLMALGLAIQYVTNLIGRLKEYDKTISDIGNRKYEARLKIAEFDNEVKTDARKALSALVNEMNNAGFSIKIKTDLSEEEAKEQFESYKKQYEDFIEDIVDLETKYAAMKKGEGGRELIGGNIEESLGNYRDTFGELLIVGSQARKELLRISEESKKLTEEQKKELKELAVNTEDSVEGYIEMANKIREIKKVDISPSFSSFGVVMSNDRTSFGGLQSKVLEGLLNTSKGFDAAAEDARNSIIKLFGEVNKDISSDDKARLKLNIDTLFLRKEIDDVTKDLAYKIYDIPKVSNIEGKSGNHETNGDPKLERDILAERISLIKELNREYEKLNKVMGSDKAAKTVMERYASQLKDVKMPKNIIGDAFLPNKENTAKALQEFSKTISDFRKRIGAQKDANVLFDEKDAEDIKKQLDKTKKNIEAMFNGLDLHKKLKDAGLSEAEVQQLFPGLAKTLDDVEKEMKASYEKNFPKGEYLVEGTDANKQYLADLDKLNQQRVKESQDLVVELTKAYKTQLSDQLQLDRWYYEERTKIAKANLTEEQKAQYEANLQKQYGKKSDENTWEAFQNTDEYIKLFENLDYSSTAAIDSILEKLEKFRGSLKSLPPEQLKTIIEQIEKLKGEKLDRNPIKGIVEAFKDLKNAKPEDKQKAIADLGTAFEKNAEKIDKFNSAFGEVASMLSSFGVDLPEGISEALSGMSQAFSGAGEFASSYATGNVLGMVTGGMKTIAGIGNTIGSLFGSSDKDLQKEIEKHEKKIRQLDRAYNSLKQSIDNAWDITMLREYGAEIDENINKQIVSLRAMIAAERDKKKTDQEKIEDWEAQIEDLQQQIKDNADRITEELGGVGSDANFKSLARDFAEAWLDAFRETGDGLSGLEQTFEDFIRNFVIQQLMLSGAEEYLRPLFDEFGEIIAAKADMSQKDQERYFQLRDKIDDLYSKAEHNAKLDKLIGFSQQAGELENSEEYKRLKREWEAYTSTGEMDTEALKEWSGKLENAKENLNKYWETIFGQLDFLFQSSGETAELSALTQSIQGITETTAEALEALLGSIRFFVSQQTTDISAIRALLDARYSLESEYSDANPMLIELRMQTGYLERLTDYISRVFAPTPNSTGPALRVVMQ